MKMLSTMKLSVAILSCTLLCLISLTPSYGFTAYSSGGNAFKLSSTYSSNSKSFSSTIFMSEQDSDMSEEEDFSPPKPAVKCPDCDKCDGSGRIIGGLGVIAPWWPIKAYRPCPNFIERGGNYVRSGQGLDEIAFGRERLENEE